MKNTKKTGMDAVLEKVGTKRSPVFKRKDSAKPAGATIMIAVGKPPAGKSEEKGEAPTLDSLLSRIEALEAHCYEPEDED